MNTLADRFEERIQTHELPPPIPRWRFVVKRVAVWSLFALSLIVGAASAAVALWFITDPQSFFAEYRDSQALYSLLDGLPYLWVFVSLGAACAAYWFYERTPHAYRHRKTLIALAVVASLICLGVGLMTSGVSDMLEQAASFVPGYASFSAPRPARFMHPEKGRILGRIESEATNTWDVRDPSGVVWHVTIDARTKFFPQVEDIEQFHPGVCVRIFGAASATGQSIQAEHINPCPRGMRMRPPPRPEFVEGVPPPQDQ